MIAFHGCFLADFQDNAPHLFVFLRAAGYGGCSSADPFGQGLGEDQNAPAKSRVA
jgi:hypothetical protein